MKKIILSGFEPFLNYKYNTSWESIKEYNLYEIKGYKIYTICLPTCFEKGRKVLLEYIEKLDPDIVIGFGMSNNPFIALERVALNLIDSEKPDNDKVILEDKKINENGEIAYFSSLPIKKIYKRLNEIGIKSVISNSAGTYVCNDLFYGIMDNCKDKNFRYIGGFIHLPHSFLKRKGYKKIYSYIEKFQSYFKIYPSFLVNSLKDIVKIIIEETIDYKDHF